MAMSDYNVNFDAMQQLIKEAESNTTEKKEFKALEDGTYVAEIKEANFCESKASGKPMLKLTYHIIGDGDNTTTYNQNVWDYTVVAGTKNDGYMCWMATKKLENIYHGFVLSGDWDKDNERLQTDWMPYATNVEFYLEIKTDKKGNKQYKVIDVWDK